MHDPMMLNHVLDLRVAWIDVSARAVATTSSTLSGKAQVASAYIDFLAA